MLFVLLLLPLVANATEPAQAATDTPAPAEQPAPTPSPPGAEPAATIPDPAAATAPAAGIAPAAATAPEPAATTEPVAATAPGQEPAYVTEALVRGPITRKDGAPAGVEWAIRDGTGRALGAVEFGRVAADPDASARVAGKRTAALVEGITLASIGTTLEMVAIGLLAGGNTSTSQGEDWLWRGTNVAVVGAFPIALCTLPSRAVRDRERWTALYYGADEADRLVAAHNAALRARLGLPPLLVTGAPAAPPLVDPPAPVAIPTPEDAPALAPVDTIEEAEPAPVVQ